ncbi:uncharacterized protein LOC132727995 [Ruditapes philippinarum]|uniref:uncharacterized protein LOC132727995 n=1 Tax=Ruditapes philippinarum TaxID=129788 RepID=UPI00295BA387|nr:uncharacterized protein LOC132727995 [Ruditapes philippinarum]
MKTYLVTTLILCGIVVSGSEDNCLRNNPYFILFPRNEALMTRAAFDSMVNKTALLGQAEFVVPTRSSYVYPETNLYCKIVKMDPDVYQRYCKNGWQTECNMYSQSLKTLNPEQTRAIYSYQYNGSEMKEAYWSKDPKKYIWRIQCEGYNEIANTCAVADVRLSLFVFNKDQFNMHVKNASRIDLYEAICVNYGYDSRFKWFFPYLGEPCD